MAVAPNVSSLLLVRAVLKRRGWDLVVATQRPAVVSAFAPLDPKVPNGPGIGVLSADMTLKERDLVEAMLLEAAKTMATQDPGPKDGAAEERNLPAAVETLERRMIEAALKRHGWNKTHAAADLGVSRRNLVRICHRYGWSGPEDES